MGQRFIVRCDSDPKSKTGAFVEIADRFFREDRIAGKLDDIPEFQANRDAFEIGYVIGVTAVLHRLAEGKFGFSVTNEGEKGQSHESHL